MHTTPPHTHIELIMPCQKVLTVNTLVITGALTTRTVTQRAMSCHHWWYLCILHLMIQTLIHLICHMLFNIHQDIHRTKLQSHKLLRYLVGLHLIHQLPCHHRPPRTEVAIFMNTWCMCLSWHQNNDNSMPLCYFSVITSCVTWMNLRQCFYIHLLL